MTVKSPRRSARTQKCKKEKKIWTSKEECPEIKPEMTKFQLTLLKVVLLLGSKVRFPSVCQFLTFI